MLHYSTHLNPTSKLWVTFVHGAGGSSSMVIDNEDNLYVIYTTEGADFAVRFGKYNQNSWNLTQFSQNESNGHEIYMVLDSSKNLPALAHLCRFSKNCSAQVRVPMLSSGGSGVKESNDLRQ